MKLQHLRHATFHLQYNGLNLLVDPMLSKKEALEPVKNSANHRRNPLVELPIGDPELRQLVKNLDAVILTHTHFDHFDAAAAELLPRELPVICQPCDTAKLEEIGFKAVCPIDKASDFKSVSFTRTSGRHGRGPIGKAMGNVSGYVLRATSEPILYIAGDTVWCSDVEKALRRHKPDIAVLYTGAAQFNSGGPITMTAEDVMRVCRTSPDTKVIAIHMEAINHCMLSRTELRQHAAANGLSDKIIIPSDGEQLEL